MPNPTGQAPRRRARLVRASPDVLRFRYVVVAGDRDPDGISIHQGALVKGTISDVVGNPANRAFTTLPANSQHRVDAVGPKDTNVAVSSTPLNGDTYRVGETIAVSITFSETVYVETERPLWLDLSVGPHLRRAPYATGSGTRTLVFHYRVQSGDVDSDGISAGPHTLGRTATERARISDAAGNEYDRRIRPLSQQADHKVNGGLPEPAVIAVRFQSSPDPGANRYYTEGDEIVIALEFTELVFATPRNDARPELVLTIGEHSRRATNVNGSGTAVLTFRYTVQNGDLDDDGISIGPGSSALIGGLIQDAASVPALRDFRGIAANPDHKVDAEPLAARSTEIVSRPRDGTTYGLGEIIEVEVEFEEAAIVTGGQQLGLGLAIGAESRRATFVDGSGSDTLMFRYTVRQGDYDADGISIGPNALVGAVIEDRAGNAWAEGDRRIPPVDPDANQKVDAGEDGVPPRIASLGIVSTPGDGKTFGLGEAITVNVEFSEAVFVTGQPTVALSIGAVVRNAAFHEGSGTDTLVFRYVVQKDDFDPDGVSIGPDALTGGSIVDAGKNDALRDSPPALPKQDAKVDGGGDPGVAGVVDVFIKPPANASYGVGDVIDVEITFNDVVHVVDQPMLTLSIGVATRKAAYLTGSGTRVLTFRYTVQQDDYDGDGISIAAGPGSLTGGTIQDDAGNDARRTFRALRAHPRYRVLADSTLPVVQGVRITSSPPAGADAYGLNDAIDIEVAYSEVVHVTDRPTLALSIGATTRQAAFFAGSGTATLRFRYLVQVGDYDADGISIAAGPGSFTGGTIQDRSGNDARRVFDALPADRRHRVRGSHAPSIVPAVRSVKIASAPAGGAYATGQNIDVQIVFTEIVHVTGGPALALSIGTATRLASYLTGSGTNRLTFRYVVRAGDYDGDGISIAAGPGSLTGGAIQNSAGIAAARTFGAVAADPKQLVDARPAVVRDIRFVSSPAADSYRTGERIAVAVTFSEPVHVAGQPVLVLSIGTASRQAAFAAGSGTNRLTFHYVVQAGDYDGDGISIAAGPGSLTGGAIQNSAGIAAARTFGAVAADPKQLVDAQPAVVQEVRFVSTPAAGVYLPGDIIALVVAFSEQVHVAGQPVLVLSIGAASRQAAFAAGSGTNELTFSYVVQTDDYDSDGISIGAGPDSFTGGTIQDRSGNDALRDFEAKAAAGTQRVGIASLPTQPVRTLTVGKTEVIDLAGVFGLPIPFACGDPCTNNAKVATASTAFRGVLTIDPLTEGTATIVVSAYEQLIVEFPVVVQADAAEVAVLEHALAAVARGMLSGASNTLGARLESPRREAGVRIGGRRIKKTPWPQANRKWPQTNPRWVQDAPTASTADWAFDAMAADSAHSAGLPRQQDSTLDHLFGSGSFEMSLLADRGTKWAVWGAGDMHAFEGKPKAGNYDGDLTSAYLGVDALGDGWMVGAAVSRSSAKADYDFTSSLGNGSGKVETTLTVFHPYMQWSLGQRGRIWASAGVGVGEASFVRDSKRSAERPKPTDLTLRMALAGLRSEWLQFGAFELALRGDAGIASLKTDDGPTALDQLAVSVQRLRIGVEAGYVLGTAAGATLTPFLDVGGRFDGGDGQTGFGVEVAAGVRYRSAMVGFEAKARTLAMHAADDYSETGASATLTVTPGTNGKGLRLSLAPRWGGLADGQDLFWSQEHVFRGGGEGGASGERRRGRSQRGQWGVAARLGYGFALRQAEGAVAPFVEYDLTQRDRQETRFGIGYAAERAGRLQFDLSGARVGSQLGTEQRWLLTVRGQL